MLPLWPATSPDLLAELASLRAENAGLTERLGEANEMLAETGRYVTPIGELFKRRR